MKLLEEKIIIKLADVGKLVSPGWIDGWMDNEKCK